MSSSPSVDGECLRGYPFPSTDIASCVAAGRACDGYKEVPKAWVFEYGTDETGGFREEKGSVDEPDHSMAILGISVFDGIFSSPYTTSDSKFAVDFWLQLTHPEGTDCPLGNALHTTLGSFVPQAAWHLKAVRHSLLSAASTALVLEARSARIGDQIEASLSKQSIVHMHLAIRAVLEERQTSMDSALSALMMSIICAWTGRWEECKRNIQFCSDLSHELRASGVHVTDDLLIAADTMLEIIHLLPPTTKFKAGRMKYAYRVIAAARWWINDVISELGRSAQSDLLHSILTFYCTRLTWIECYWRDLVHNTNDINPIGIEYTAFAPAVLHVQQWSEGSREAADFDMRLLTVQLTLALKLTLLYGASGNAQRLREAAFACHVKLQYLVWPPDSEEDAVHNAAAPS